MKREITKHLAGIFDIMGISIYPQGCKRKLATRLITTSFMLLGTAMVLMYIITNRHAFQDVALGTCCLSSCINAVFAYLILHFKSKSIRQLLHIMDDDTFRYSDESEIAPNYSWTSYDRNMKFISVAIFGFLYTCMLFLCVTSVLLVLFVGMETIYMYPGWTPWNSMILDFLSQMVTLSVVCCSYSLTYMFVLTMCFEFERQFQRLRTALTNLEGRSLAKSNESEVLYSKFMLENLVECVKHHQKLVRAFNLLSSWSTITFSTRLVCYTIMLVLGIFSIFEPISLQYKATMCVAIVLPFAELFSWGYVGNRFSTINDRISETIFYRVPWYEQPMKIRQLLILFHLLVKSRSFTILGFSVIGAGYSTFAQICRISYSYVNMLKSVF